MAVIGLLHPGEMGAAVGACLTGAGHTVLWEPTGRSTATAGRAGEAGLTGAPLRAIAARSEVILSVCPPHAALDVARTVARAADGAGFTGVYTDANAVSPQTARRVAEVIRQSGAAYVDGGIIGPPPARPGSTRLYLSGGQDLAGDRASAVRDLFAGSALDARVLTASPAGASPYGASALKMSYAAWTKASAALLLAARALARAEGVDGDLLAEWELSQPALRSQWERAAASAAAKGWRWTGEMEEIAASMTAHGLPDGFHLAAADVFASEMFSTSHSR
jgi:3-hydroxyisobutyrate dehydrogenase-like beta-hydroxyacid dehydrogenase